MRIPASSTDLTGPTRNASSRRKASWEPSDLVTCRGSHFGPRDRGRLFRRIALFRLSSRRSVLFGSSFGVRRGGVMQTVMAHHDVKDTKHWLASSKRKEIFEPIGVTNIRTFVDPQQPTRVGL